MYNLAPRLAGRAFRTPPFGTGCANPSYSSSAEGSFLHPQGMYCLATATLRGVGEVWVGGWVWVGGGGVSGGG